MVLSNIPSCPGVFPIQSFFTNIDYLFWRIPKQLDLSYFRGFMVHLENQNAKLFNHKTRNYLHIHRTVEIEGALWAGF